MNINGPKSCNTQNVLGQNGVSHHHEKVGTKGTKFFFKFRSLQICRLQNRQAVFQSQALYRRRSEHTATTRRAVRLSNYSNNISKVTFFQVLQETSRKFRRTHKYNLHAKQYRISTFGAL